MPRLPDAQKQPRRSLLPALRASLSGPGRHSGDAGRGGHSPCNRRRSPPLKTAPSAPVRNILLIGLRSLGDVILTTGAISALRELYPGARIDYLTRAPYDSLLEEEPGIHRAFCLPSRKKSLFSNLWVYGRFLLEIRRQGYDLVIDFFARGPRSRIITLFSGATFRLGLVDKSAWIHRRLDRYIYTMAVCPPVQLALTRDRIPYLISRLGRLGGVHLPRLTVNDKDLTRARDLLAEEGILEGRYWIFFCGSGARTKNWPPDRFSEIAGRLLGEGFHVLCLGGMADREQQEAFSASFGTLPPGVHLRTQLPWGTLKGLCRLARGTLSNDSGPAHLAQAVGSPCLVLFGPGDHVSYAPFFGSFLKADLACQPCQTFAARCPDNQCMKLISSEAVWEEIRRLPAPSALASFSGE